MTIEKLSACDDAALVALAGQQLPYITQAYEALMQRYYRLILSACNSMLRDTDEAEEASQDVMLKVFNALPRFENRASFKTWLMKITTNTCITRSKKRRLENERYTLDSDGYYQDNAVDDSSDPSAIDDTSFDTMMQGLSDEERQLLTLRFVGELNLPEIAKLMGLGLSAVKMRYYRALEKLKAQQED